MTYISRKERIIVPRWLDEYDAEYKLRATRKRSDGRLKRHISCDDLRAWVNNEHLNNEYFLELMSDGEAAGKKRVRLFGRYVPVPVLIKLVQNVKDGDFARKPSSEEGENQESRTSQDFESDNNPKSYASEVEQRVTELSEDPKKEVDSISQQFSAYDQPTQKRAEKIVDGQTPRRMGESFTISTGTSNQTPRKRNEDGSIADYTWYGSNEVTSDVYDNSDKVEGDSISLQERKFNECVDLLSKAIDKLERIDNMANLAIAEAENAENEELQINYDRSKSDSSLCNGNQTPPYDMQSRANVRRARDSAKYMELLRKISGLRQKLKKVQDCRMKINEQMRMHRESKFCTNYQVTELYSRREQAKFKRLQKKLEKLISKKGKILSELTDAVSCLNKLKRSASRSRSTLFSKRNMSRMTFDQEENFQLGEPVPCTCGCQCSENNFMSSESEKFEFSDSISSEKYFNKLSAQQQDYSAPEDPLKFSRRITPSNKKEEFYYDKNPDYNDKAQMADYQNYNLDDSSSAQDSMRTEQLNSYADMPQPRSESYESPSTKTYLKIKSPQSDSRSTRNSEPRKGSKQHQKSKLKFVCPDSLSKKNEHPEDLEYYESLSNKTEQFTQRSQKNRKSSMNPNQPDSMGKRREFDSARRRRAVDLGKNKRPSTSPFERTLRRESDSPTPARKFRSETTMKEIEKALRNYDERLNGLDSIEFKIQKLREKLSDSNRKRQELLIERDEGKKQKAAEQEKSNREITKLCSENWELKLQVQKLAAKSDVQHKKLQTLKSNKKKVKELESETEDLKKELSEYQDSFQDQRKCITMLESVVAVQRTEIKKLMGLIKKLTTMDRMATCCSDKRNLQRSRSYSPEPHKSRRVCCRPKMTRCGASSDEDCSVVCCEDYYQHETRRNQEKNYDRRFYSPEPSKRMGWCIN